MNRDQLEGKLDGFRASVKQKWAKLTDDDIMEFEGNLDELSAKIQQSYGDSREYIKQQLKALKEKI